MAINKVMVLGAGTMGMGIAQVFAEAGKAVIVRDIADAFIQRGEGVLKKNMEKKVAKGKITEEQKNETLGRVSFTLELADAKDCDLVVEAAIEVLDIKKSIFKELDEVCKPETILASNTSSISITAIAAATKRPQQVLGMHFFNPAPAMKLVEVIRGARTNDETFQAVYGCAKDLGKNPVEVGEAPGFVVNRILFPMINEAIIVLENGIASKEDIDTAMMYGANHKMGPLALADLVGLDICLAIMETIYYKTGNEFWKKTAQFWMKLFGINFAIGVATGLILEFEFGTNWSNYSWFVGDIFGAPLAIEGILAFFMEATFIAVMFFGWDKVSKRFHLASTWLTIIGATLSALWILIANAWMQYPVGMHFNPDTVRNEMFDFWAVALSPVAINKFFHTVLSGWIVGAVFVMGVSSWYLLKKRETEFSLESIKVGAVFGLVASILIVWTGDGSAYQVAQKQPMKLAAMEGLYEGGNGTGPVAIGLLNPDKTSYKDNVNPFIFDIKIPKLLSFLAERDVDAYVPGIVNLIEGGYTTNKGTVALSAAEKIEKGRIAIQALADYRKAVKDKDQVAAEQARSLLDENFAYFGYGYIKDPADLVPHVGLTFYSFRVMVLLGGYFILLFIVALIWSKKNKFADARWLQWASLWTIPLAYIAGQAGWIVAEVGRQPWAIQDILPTGASVSKLATSSVQTTFFVFLFLFTVLLIAEIGIMVKAIKKGPSVN